MKNIAEVTNRNWPDPGFPIQKFGNDIRRGWVFLFLVLASIGITTKVQADTLWSGIIDPSRAIDWTGAGIPGGLPDANWTQCGNTIAAYSGTASTINTAIASCGANQYVLLGPGTFNLSTSIDFDAKSNIVLRGSGANSTFLVFDSGAGTVSSCNTGETQLIGICGNKESWWSSPTVYNWTAGYAQGTNSITLSGTSGIKTVSTGNPTLLVLNQDDIGYSGYPATGSAVDNGNYFVCADKYADPSNDPTGCASNGPDANPPSPFTHRWQEEIVTVTAVNSSTGVVTLSQPLKHPNWQSGLSPTAILWTPTVVSDGVENLSIDMGSNSAFGYAIAFYGAYQGWVSGVRIMNGYNWQINTDYCSHMQIQNNYLFNGAGTDSYGIRIMHSADNLIVNNIFQQIRASIVFDDPDTGSVIAYNFAVNDTSSNANNDMYGAYWDHSTGDDFHLWEGNIGPGLTIDNVHGTHLDETAFRNFFTGWESCANGQCGTYTAKNWGTSAIDYAGYNRYGNIIANVAGTPGYTDTYQSSSWSNNEADSFLLGYGNPSASIPVDSLTASSSLRWGNYDVATGTVHWCGNSSDTGWTSTCAIEDIPTSEVPVSDPTYPNAVPSVGDIGAGQPALPASFYYSSKPSWWGNLPWPAIGPDVSGGNVGYCSGTLNTPGEYAGVPATSNAQCAGTSLVNNASAWAGHVNTNPAMNCALNIMGMPPDGTGSVLPFDASNCYGSTNSILYGDVIDNGRVTIYDAELTAQYAIGLPVANFDRTHAQVDGNSTVDIYDAYLIAEYAVGLITKFAAVQQ